MQQKYELTTGLQGSASQGLFWADYRGRETCFGSDDDNSGLFKKCWLNLNHNSQIKMNLASSQASMKVKKVKEGEAAQQVQLRRSSRDRKPTKDNARYMSSFSWEENLANDGDEEQFNYRRKRKNNRFDDSEDYNEIHRPYRKRQPSGNQVQSLLEWRLAPSKLLPFYVNDTQTKIDDIKLFTETICSKNVANEHLEDIAPGIEALFINIDWNKKNQTMKDFEKLNIESSRLMPKGLVFVWAHKELISYIMRIMDFKNFNYVENLEVVNFDIALAQEYPRTSKDCSKSEQESQVEEREISEIVRHLDGVDPNSLIRTEPSAYFNNSKRTLLMFRRISQDKLQLRHQRTCDVVFDMPASSEEKCSRELKHYLCHMIQTLLPECLRVNGKSNESYPLRMLELWADKGQPRRGWIQIIQN